MAKSKKQPHVQLVIESRELYPSKGTQFTRFRMPFELRLERNGFGDYCFFTHSR